MWSSLNAIQFLGIWSGLKKLRAQADRPEFKFEPLDSSAGEFGAGCHTSLSFGFLIELMWG